MNCRIRDDATYLLGARYGRRRGTNTRERRRENRQGQCRDDQRPPEKGTKGSLHFTILPFRRPRDTSPPLVHVRSCSRVPTSTVTPTRYVRDSDWKAIEVRLSDQVPRLVHRRDSQRSTRRGASDYGVFVTRRLSSAADVSPARAKK